MVTACPIHSFDISFEQAKHIQSELCGMVALSDTISNIDEIDYVGGADVAFITTSTDVCESASSVQKRLKKNDTAIAAVVVLNVKRGCIVETVYAATPVFRRYCSIQRNSLPLRFPILWHQ